MEKKRKKNAGSVEIAASLYNLTNVNRSKGRKRVFVRRNNRLVRARRGLRGFSRYYYAPGGPFTF